MAKLVFTPSPTFKATVDIPVPGCGYGEVEFVFKHKTREEADAWVKSLVEPEVSDIDSILDIATGWDLDQTFSRESLEELDGNYLGATKAVITKYIAELSGARVKN